MSRWTALNVEFGITALNVEFGIDHDDEDDDDPVFRHLLGYDDLVRIILLSDVRSTHL